MSDVFRHGEREVVSSCIGYIRAGDLNPDSN